VNENESLKKEIFARLDVLCRPGVVLASNTSSIPITRIGAAILLFTGVGFIIPVYLVVWAITPVQPYRPRNLSPDEERFWTSVSDRPRETFSNIRYKFKDMDDRLARMERAVTSEEWKLKREFRDLEGR
jgi:phage shock protein C